MNIQRKLQRFWQRLFVYRYIDERILDEKFNIELLMDCNPGSLLPSDVRELVQSRRNLWRLLSFHTYVA